MRLLARARSTFDLILRRSPFWASLIGLLCVIATPAPAVTFADKDFAQLVSESDQIFVGTVKSIQSRRLTNGTIVTDVRFSDKQPIKGSNAGADIVLLVLGGEVDGERLEIPGLPQFERDARYLVFSQGNGRNMFPVVGGPAGFFRVIAEPQGGRSIVLDWSGKPLRSKSASDVLQSVSPEAQGSPKLPITLDVFLAAIKAKLGRQ